MSGMSAAHPELHDSLRLAARSARQGTLSRRRLRRDTPGCQNVAHLNNAGAGLSPDVVVDRMVDHLRLEAERGAYEAARSVADEVEEGRALVAGLVGVRPEHLAFVASATAGLHRVLSTVHLQRGDRVLVSGAEYASTMLPLLQLSHRIGLRVDVIPDDTSGTTDVAALTRMLDDDVRLVCAVHAPSHNGLVNDVAGIGAALRGQGSDAWYLVDACQSVGQLPLDVPALGADFLVASGRKYLRGPRGSGFLAVSPRALAHVDAYPVDVAGARWLHSDDYVVDESARRFESFETSIAVTLGLIRAVRYAQDISVPVLAGAISRNAEYLRCHLGATGAWQVQDRGRVRSGIVTVRHERISAGHAVAMLHEAGVNAWEVASDLNPRDLAGRSVVRLSPHAYNTTEELDLAVDVLARL